MSSTQQRRDYTTQRKQIGMRLRRVRKDLGLTQAELARRINFSCGTISTLETGEARREQTLIEHVTYIANALRQDVQWLLTGELPKVAVVATPQPKPVVVSKPGPYRPLTLGSLQRAGRKIRAGRNAMGITQAKFAELVKIDPGTLSSIERGFSKIHFELHAQQCCEVLGVEYNWLFELVDGTTADAPSESPSEQLIRLERKLDRLLKHFNIK